MGRAIELFYSGSNSMDISGWALGSDRTSLDAFRLPVGTVMEPGQFFVLHESMWIPSDMDRTSDWQVSGSERIYLSELDAQGSFTERRVSTSVLSTYWNESFGKYQLSHGEVSARLHEPTFGVSIR